MKMIKIKVYTTYDTRSGSHIKHLTVYTLLMEFPYVFLFQLPWQLLHFVSIIQYKRSHTILKVNVPECIAQKGLT